MARPGSGPAFHPATSSWAFFEVNMAEAPSTVLVFAREGMGSTDRQDLRERLTVNFLRLLLEGGMLPDVICFYTEGVRLACRGSAAIEPLKELEERGVRLVLCST